MRVLVTGAAGFIGSHLSEALLSAGHEVVGIDCFEPHYPRLDKEQNLTGSLSRPTFQLHELDLREDDLAPALEGVEVVVHEAAKAGLPSSWSDFRTYQDCNLYATHRVAEAAIEAGVKRIVHASTSSVYGRTAVGDESRPTEPASPYGITKLAAEKLLWAYGERLPEVVVLRYFSIYGPRQRPDMAYRIFCERMIDGQDLVIFGDGKQSRSNTYVDDCVAATVAAVTADVAGSTFNIGGGSEISLLDALAVLADELDVKPDFTHGPERVGDQRRTVADVTRAENELGYRPTTSPDQGLRALARWCLARRDKEGPST